MRCYELGCVAWFLNVDECRFLTYALEQAIVVAKRIRDNSNLLGEKEGFFLAPKALNLDAPESEKWVDERLSLPNLVSVAEGDRPYFPRFMLCVHHESGMILFAHAAAHDAEAVGADIFISDSLPGIEMAREEMEEYMS
jgi:hypothetical protein